VDKKEKKRRALERLTSSEEIDQMLNIVQPNRKRLITVVGAILAILVLWAFLGRIPVEVSGRGVALSPRGVFAIEAKASGTVTDIHVKEGEIVTPQTRIVTVDDPQRMAILRTIEATKHRISSLQEELVTLKERLVTRTGLFDEGLIAKTVLEDTELSVIQKQIEIEDAKAKLASHLSDLEKTSSLGKLPESEILEKYKVEPSTIDLFLSQVYSPKEGRVLEVLVNEGDVVKVEDPLVWMEHPHKEEESIQFVCCIPVQDRERIRIGMSARLEPNTVNPQEYGAIIGTVEEVSTFVVSEQELLNTLHNKQLVNYLTGGAEAVIRLMVQPELNASTPSGLRWTSGEGPPFKIPTGTVCNVKIVVEEQPPISYLFPIWKLKPM